MKHLATLFWAVVYYAIWTPLSIVLRRKTTRAWFLQHPPRSTSLWRARARRGFADMTKQS
jgi:hypothetical protein